MTIMSNRSPFQNLCISSTHWLFPHTVDCRYSVSRISFLIFIRIPKLIFQNTQYYLVLYIYFYIFGFLEMSLCKLISSINQNLLYTIYQFLFPWAICLYHFHIYIYCMSIFFIHIISIIYLIQEKKLQLFPFQ